MLKVVKEGRTLNEAGRPLRIEHRLDDNPPKAFFFGRGRRAVESDADCQAAFDALIPNRYRPGGHA
jgi:hypothetical protein